MFATSNKTTIFSLSKFNNDKTWLQKRIKKKIKYQLTSSYIFLILGIAEPLLFFVLFSVATPDTVWLPYTLWAFRYILLTSCIWRNSQKIFFKIYNKYLHVGLLRNSQVWIRFYFMTSTTIGLRPDKGFKLPFFQVQFDLIHGSVVVWGRGQLEKVFFFLFFLISHSRNQFLIQVAYFKSTFSS